MEIGIRKNLNDFTIHLYTDGLTEAMNSFEEEYGEERFQSFVDTHINMDPDEFHTVFLEKMSEFSQDVPLTDDLTLLSLRFQ